MVVSRKHRQNLMLHVATRLGDLGFSVDPRFRLTLVGMIKDISAAEPQGAQLIPGYGQPIYIKYLRNGQRVVAKVSRYADGMIDPSGLVHFETWHGRDLVDVRDEKIQAFLRGLGPKPVTNALRITVGKIKELANA